MGMAPGKAGKMRIRIVLAEPEYSENIGLVARAMKNFGFSELWLVKPKAGHLNDAAKSRAMHAADMLKRAKIAGSLEEAVEGCAYAVATTAKAVGRKNAQRNAISLGEFCARFAGSGARVALVFGRESSGLKNSEIGKCDFVMTVPSAKGYRTLNLSHAVAIVLYAIFVSGKAEKFKSAKPKTKKRLLIKFAGIIEKARSIDNREKVGASAKALVSRALISESEAKAMLALLSEIERR